jgi:hypothetical protein
MPIGDGELERGFSNPEVEKSTIDFDSSVGISRPTMRNTGCSRSLSARSVYAAVANESERTVVE